MRGAGGAFAPVPAVQLPAACLFVTSSGAHLLPLGISE